MEYKTVEDGKSILMDEKGRPVVKDKDGNEFGLDAIHLYSKIPALQDEAKTHREAKETAIKQLELFQGIDPKKAKEALKTIENIDAKKMIDAGEVESLKRQLTESYDKEIKTLKEQLQTNQHDFEGKIKHKDELVFDLMVNNQFANSKFLGEKTTMTPDVAALVFGRNFKIEKINDKLQPVGYLPNGEKIYSRERHGDVAAFDEAFSVLWESYSNREQYMRANSGGPDAKGNLKTDSRGTIHLTKEQAKDVSVYRQAKKQAMESGVRLAVG